MKTVLQKNFILEGRFTLDDDFYSLFDGWFTYLSLSEHFNCRTVSRAAWCSFCTLHLTPVKISQGEKGLSLLRGFLSSPSYLLVSAFIFAAFSFKPALAYQADVCHSSKLWY